MAVEEFHQEEAFRDSVSHIDKDGHRVFFHPKKPHGKLYNARKLLSYFYLIIFFTLPFIKVGGEPLFLFDVLERKFILFSVRFWPQDFFLFVLGMLIFIIFVALFTVVYGRVFCGWICPQTVFLEMVFRRIEYAIDGDSAEQRALKKSEWTPSKIRKRILKNSLFFLISFLVANTFLSYLIGVDSVIKIATEPIGQHIGGFIAIVVFSGVFFFVFAWFREQACIVVCPYGRMQGVLLDKRSIVVAYDHKRGEERAKFSKHPAPGTGDCIDCFECVRVCPTGIDIRNGTQLECTNCTACMDACDHIMEKIDRPKGLIRYASENTIQTGKRLRWTHRMIAYTSILFVLIGLETFLLTTRSDVDVTVIRTRGTTFYLEDNGDVSNLFNVKVINKTHHDLPITFEVDNGSVKVIGNAMTVKKDSLLDGEFFITIPPSLLESQKSKIKIRVVSNGEVIGSVKTNFIAPGNKINRP